MPDLRDQELNWLVMAVEQDHAIAVGDDTPALVILLDGVAGQKHAQAAREGLVPFLIRHFMAVGVEPYNVLQPADFSPLEEMAAAEQPMLFAKRYEAADPGQETPVILAPVPVKPAQFVILTVGV